MTKLTLISSPTCPYVQRAVIALKEKHVEFDVVYVDLQDKPDWFLDISPLGKVPGSTLQPGPARIPAHGTLTYRGRRYLANSFDATAFPSGKLRISLLVPLS